MAETIIEKRQRCASLIRQAREKLDAGNMEAYNKFDADIDNLQAEIKAEEKQQQRENALNHISDTVHSLAEPTQNVKGNTLTGAASNEYKSAFLNAMRFGKNGVTAEEKALFTNVMSVGTDANGGYLVMPAELEKDIRNYLGKDVAMRSLATVIKSAADRDIPICSNRGAATWIAENGSYGTADDTYDTKTLKSYKLGKIIKESEELLNDSAFDLGSEVTKSFGQSFGEAEEDAYIIGDGTGKPTGVLVSAQNGVTTAASTALTSDEILDLFYSVKKGYRKNGTFLMSSSTEKAIRKLKDNQGQYIWMPGLGVGDVDNILHSPIAISDSMPEIAAGNKILAFGDFKQYEIKDTVGMGVQILDQLYAENGQIGYKGFERTDGKLLIAEAVKVLTMKAAS